MNYSWQRQTILDTVMQQKQHLTANELYRIIRPKNPHLSLGTVYRNLNLLVETGVLGRVSVSGEPDRFDWEPPPHAHLYCRKCGKVVNLEIPTQPVADLLAQCQGVRVERYSLLVTGLCADCSRAEAAE